MKDITIALLVKQKAAILPSWLEMIEALDYPKERINLFVRTNNNTDNTTAILRQWVSKVQGAYRQIHFDDSDASVEVEKYGVHEWNAQRFALLAAIRDSSIAWARGVDSDYFVVDCDNYLVPDTLRRLQAWNVPVVAPLLHCVDPEQPGYSNYHSLITPTGYYVEHENYYNFLAGRIRGCIEMPVVHCTYYIKGEYLPQISYHDGSEDYEYVIFSRNLRAKGIPQYLDNTKLYGYLTLREYGNLAFDRTKKLS